MVVDDSIDPHLLLMTIGASINGVGKSMFTVHQWYNDSCKTHSLYGFWGVVTCSTCSNNFSVVTWSFIFHLAQTAFIYYWNHEQYCLYCLISTYVLFSLFAWPDYFKLPSAIIEHHFSSYIYMHWSDVQSSIEKILQSSKYQVLGSVFLAL